MKSLVASMVIVVATTGISVASDVSVDVSTPNARVQVGTHPPPPPPVRVVEREHVIVKEKEYTGKHDHGKHKGHYKNKKYKKPKKYKEYKENHDH